MISKQHYSGHYFNLHAKAKSNQYPRFHWRSFVDFLIHPLFYNQPSSPLLSSIQTKPTQKTKPNANNVVSLRASMAVDLAGVAKIRMEEQIAIEEAASAGLKSMEHLIRVLSSQIPSSSASASASSSSSTHHHRLNLNHLDCTEITDFTVSKFKQVINLLNRTGHARFRRAPSHPSPSLPSPPHPQPQKPTLHFANPKLKSNPNPNPNPSSTDLSVSQYSKTKDTTFSISPPISTTTSSFMSSVTADGSVSDGKIGPTIIASGKPPLSSSHRKRCHDATLSAGKTSSSAHCHCSKRR